MLTELKETVELLQDSSKPLVQRAGAVTTAMLGNLKSLLTILCAVGLFGVAVPLSCAFGYATSLLAGAGYTYVVMREERAAEPDVFGADLAARLVKEMSWRARGGVSAYGPDSPRGGDA